MSPLPDLAWLVHEADNEPLRYSMRSLATHAHGMFRKAWIVGTLPEWATGAGFIPVAEPKPREKFASIRAKVEALAADRRVTRQVVILNDDVFARDMVNSWEPTHLGRTSTYVARNARPRNTWWDALQQTAEHIGGDPLCYAGHIPLLYDRARLREALAGYPTSRRLLDCGLYPVAGAGGEGVEALNAKVGPDDMWKLDDPRMPGWVSTNDVTWAGALGARIRADFPDPSPWEA